MTSEMAQFSFRISPTISSSDWKTAGWPQRAPFLCRPVISAIPLCFGNFTSTQGFWVDCAGPWRLPALQTEAVLRPGHPLHPVASWPVSPSPFCLSLQCWKGKLPPQHPLAGIYHCPLPGVVDERWLRRPDTHILKATRNYGSRWAVGSYLDARDMFLYIVNIFPLWISGECVQKHIS